jgi:hypothetical protein
VTAANGRPAGLWPKTGRSRAPESAGQLSARRQGGYLLATMLCGVVAGLLLTLATVNLGGGPGSATAGPWTGWPRGGASDADPYTRAIIARRGDLPMGLAEGLAFFATADSTGRALSTRCAYVVSGRFPASRAWTLAAYTPDGKLLSNPSRRYALTSAEAVRAVDGAATVQVAAYPAGGNWLPLGGDGPFVLALRLYETPLAAAAGGLSAADLPAITRRECG